MQGTAPEVTIVIVTWNSGAHLASCLECLDSQTFKDFEVVIVDNGSSDGSVDMLEQAQRGFDLRVARLGRNTGFTAGNNTGAKLACGRWLALLNADAFAEPCWLEALLAAAHEHPEFSFFASRQVQANAPDLLDGAGDVYHVSGLAWRRGVGQPVEQYATREEEVFGACAAAALYKKEAFLEAGGFDEDYFSYHEDVDLSFRLRLRGYRCLYVPGAAVRHIGSASTGRRSAFSTYYGHRNLVWTYIKDMPASLLAPTLPLHLLMTGIFLLWFSLNGQAGAIWRAKWDALAGLGKMLRKRKGIQANRRARVQLLQRQMEANWLAPLRARLSQSRR